MEKYLNIDSFIWSYFNTSLWLAKQNLTLDNFDSKIKKELSSKFNLTESNIFDLHHPFHWVLFCNNKNSPLELTINGKRINHPPILIKVKQALNPAILNELVSYFNCNYRNLFIEKVDYIGIKTLPQLA